MLDKAQRVAPVAIQALKDALSQIYWYKSDLRSFIAQSVDDPHLLGRVNWNESSKRDIVEQLINALASNQEAYLGTILMLMANVVAMRDFSHLEQFEDGGDKARRAERAVAALRSQYGIHASLLDEKRQVEDRRKRALEERLKNDEFRRQLVRLNERFSGLVSSTDAQGRGYELEKLLKDIFDLFELDPRASFRCEGEQIDGAFTFDSTDYVVESKWTKEQIGIEQLDAFNGKIGRRLDNTLGLYVSINGYSTDAVKRFSGGRSVMILIDGSHVMAILEGRIDLFNLLLRVRRFAAETGQIYVPVHQLL